MNTTFANLSDTHRSIRTKSLVTPLKRARSTVPVPLLVNGDKLNSKEFLRRYMAMPNLKKAELIEGIVYFMTTPVRHQQHSSPDGKIQTCMGVYAFETPGVEHGINGTVKLDADNIFQPDGLLRKLPEKGGMTRVDEDGYLAGPPELIVEIAASSASIDLHRKRDVYLRHGVPEYIVWLTEDAVFMWWYLENGEYHLIPADKEGILRSRVFPGLWLDAKALLKGDGAKVMKVLRRGLKSKEHAKFVK